MRRQTLRGPKDPEHAISVPERREDTVMRYLPAMVALCLLPCAAANAEMNGAVRVGVLNDMSSVYADFQGAGSVLAAQMAVEDFAKTSKRKIEVLSADHQNKPDIGAAIANDAVSLHCVGNISDSCGQDSRLAPYSLREWNLESSAEGNCFIIGGVECGTAINKVCTFRF